MLSSYPSLALVSLSPHSNLEATMPGYCLGDCLVKVLLSSPFALAQKTVPGEKKNPNQKAPTSEFMSHPFQWNHFKRPGGGYCIPHKTHCTTCSIATAKSVHTKENSTLVKIKISLKSLHRNLHNNNYEGSPTMCAVITRVVQIFKFLKINQLTQFLLFEHFINSSIHRSLGIGAGGFLHLLLKSGRGSYTYE